MSEIVLEDPDVVAGLLLRAAEANHAQSTRRGATAVLPDRGRLLVTGDLHDHLFNYQKIVRFAELDESPRNHLVLHEMIHGGRLVNGMDMSVRMLARIAALKVRYPEQVHLLMGNHELAQLRGEAIYKENVSVVEAFERGVEYVYGESTDVVLSALKRFLASLLLAVRCPLGILVSHSLPGDRSVAKFDVEVLNRFPTPQDLAPGGAAHDLVWGRRHSDAVAERLGEAMQIKLFVTGHQPAEFGHYTEGDRILILASDHEHGVVLPVNLSRSYTMDQLVDSIVPLAALPI